MPRQESPPARRLGYAGPDNPGAVVSGNCRDNAGNVGDSCVLTQVRLDAAQRRTHADEGEESRRGHHLAGLAGRQAGRGDARTGGQGSSRQRRLQRYGHELPRCRARQPAASTPTWSPRSTRPGTGPARRRAMSERAPSSAPAPAQRASAAPPLLTWTPVKGAAYYNVQILRGTRVLSAWPAKTSLQLKRTWVMNGRRYRLRPGVYRWYVWPGYGRLAANRYGSRLGGSTFVVTG